MMRRLRSLMAIAAALLLASRSMRAQGGDAPTPKPVSFELRVAPTGILGERNYAFGTAVTATTGMMTGAEIIARWRYVGLGVRVFSGAFGDSLAGTKFKVVNGDVSLLAGPREFSAEAGYAKRALLSTTADQVFTFLRIGARSTLSVGSTGLSVTLGYWQYLPQGDNTLRVTSGREAESGLSYDFATMPLYLTVGYRTELFEISSNPLSGAPTTPEEVRGIRVALGLRFGAKPQ